MRRSSETHRAFSAGSGYALFHNIPTKITLETTIGDLFGYSEQVVIVQPLLSRPTRERLDFPYLHSLWT